MPVTQNHWHGPGRRRVAGEGRPAGDGSRLRVGDRGSGVWTCPWGGQPSRVTSSPCLKNKRHVLLIPTATVSGGVQSPLRVQSQLRSGPPLPSGILSCPGAGWNGQPLTHGSPGHSSGRLSSGSQRAVPTPAAATLQELVSNPPSLLGHPSLLPVPTPDAMARA